MKKIHRLTALLLSFLLLSASPIFAEDSSADEEEPFSLKLTTDLAYYPASECITGPDHFAPITGPYSGLEARTTLTAAYEIATPLGEHWLLSGANIVVKGECELSPVSIRPKAAFEFSPLPFLIFSAGASAGLGWNIPGIGGFNLLNKTNMEYEKLSTFNHPYYDLWASATFQFDTGAIIAGDWTHVVILASYKAIYSGIGGLAKESVYEWQCSKNKAAGLSYEAQGVLGYQMPLVLSLAGLMFKTEGFYDGSVYGSYDENFDGAFAAINISPLMQFKLGDKDGLTCLFDFSSRRSFDQKFSKPAQSLLLTKTGREWFFNRLALSWTHTFM